MSTAGILERLERRADDRRIDGRQVALDVDDGLDLAVGIERDQRLEDAVRARFVVDARHHRLEAMRAHRVRDALPYRSPRPRGRARPRAARPATWTIIGAPAMSASGLPGRRVEAMRAGIRISVDMEIVQGGSKRGWGKWQKVSLEAPL